MTAAGPLGTGPALETVGAALAGAAGWLPLVAGTFSCGLLLLNALVSGLGWVVTRDQRELADAAGFLADAAVPFTLAVLGACYREKLQRALAAKGERERAEAGPWGRQGHRRGP